MSKICPECGENVPDDAHFCRNCGHEFYTKGSSVPVNSKKAGKKSNGMLVPILIAIIVILAVALFFSWGNGGGDSGEVSESSKFGLVITEVSGSSYDYDDGDKTNYMLDTSALFTNIPSDMNNYIVRTTYFDKNDDRIGQVTESLSEVIYKIDDEHNYPHSFGYYNSYKKLNPDHVSVEISKGGKLVANDTFEVDRNSIEFL